MAEELDLRGLKCPEPAIRTGRALRNADELLVIVDDDDAIQNISRGAIKRGYKVNVRTKGKDHYLQISKIEGSEERSRPDLGKKASPTVVFFPSNTVGRGEDELGSILAKSLIYSILEVEPKPDVFIFMNSGVKLAVDGSESLEDLEKLRDGGVEILVCGTCLDFFDLKDRLAVGEISNAYTIAEILLGAGKVVRF